MAKFDKGILGKISGKMGATQFYPSKRGNIMRTKPIPVNTWSPARERVIHRMLITVQSWALVSFEMTDAWNAFASGFTFFDKVSNELTYNGRDMFIGLNTNKLEINEPVIIEPPKKIYSKNFTSIEAEIISPFENIVPDTKINDIKLHFRPAISENTKFIVSATALLKPGVNYIKPCCYRKIAVIDSAFLSGSSILNEYKTVFPFFSLRSAKIAFLSRPVSTISGLALPETEIKCANYF